MPRDDNDNLSLDDLQKTRQIKNLADEPGMSDLFGKETVPEGMDRPAYHGMDNADPAAFSPKDNIPEAKAADTPALNGESAPDGTQMPESDNGSTAAGSRPDDALKDSREEYDPYQGMKDNLSGGSPADIEEGAAEAVKEGSRKGFLGGLRESVGNLLGKGVSAVKNGLSSFANGISSIATTFGMSAKGLIAVTSLTGTASVFLLASGFVSIMNSTKYDEGSFSVDCKAIDEGIRTQWENTLERDSYTVYVARKIYSVLSSEEIGFTDQAIAAILSNFMGQTGLDPYYFEGYNGHEKGCDRFDNLSDSEKERARNAYIHAMMGDWGYYADTMRSLGLISNVPTGTAKETLVTGGTVFASRMNKPALGIFGLSGDDFTQLWNLAESVMEADADKTKYQIGISYYVPDYSYKKDSNGDHTYDVYSKYHFPADIYGLGGSDIIFDLADTSSIIQGGQGYYSSRNGYNGTRYVYVASDTDYISKSSRYAHRGSDANHIVLYTQPEHYHQRASSEYKTDRVRIWDDPRYIFLNGFFNGTEYNTVQDTVTHRYIFEDRVVYDFMPVASPFYITANLVGRLISTNTYSRTVYNSIWPSSYQVDDVYSEAGVKEYYKHRALDFGKYANMVTYSSGPSYCLIKVPSYDAAEQKWDEGTLDIYRYGSSTPVNIFASVQESLNAALSGVSSGSGTDASLARILSSSTADRNLIQSLIFKGGVNHYMTDIDTQIAAFIITANDEEDNSYNGTNFWKWARQGSYQQTVAEAADLFCNAYMKLDRSQMTEAELNDYLGTAEYWYDLMKTSGWSLNRSGADVYSLISGNINEAVVSAVHDLADDSFCEPEIGIDNLNIAYTAISVAFPSSSKNAVVSDSSYETGIASRNYAYFDVYDTEHVTATGQYRFMRCTSLYMAVFNLVRDGNDIMYSSGDRVAATVIRASGADDDFPFSDVSKQRQHLMSSDKWRHILDYDSDSSEAAKQMLEQGDILIYDDQIYVFVGPELIRDKWPDSGTMFEHRRESEDEIDNVGVVSGNASNDYRKAFGARAAYSIPVPDTEDGKVEVYRLYHAERDSVYKRTVSASNLSPFHDGSSKAVYMFGDGYLFTNVP